MLITIDVSHPDNDVELVGLAPGQTPETFFGVRGYTAYRLFNAAARLLFLAIQKHTSPDIVAATGDQIEREIGFIRQRLDELGRDTRPSSSPKRRR
jgi:hypothetical protein